MKDFGNKKYGVTGTIAGWKHYYANLTPFAGKTVKVRFLYATDAAFEDTGWFLDDLALTNGTTTVWSDDAEANNGWTATVGTYTDSSGAGWVLDPGKHDYAQYYLVEWRNFDGFDKGLQYAYDTTYQKARWRRCVEGREDQVQRPWCTRLVPRHVVRQRQPRAQQPHVAPE